MNASPTRPLVVITESPSSKQRFAAKCGRFVVRGNGVNDAAREAAARYFSHELGRKVIIRDVFVAHNADGGKDLVAVHRPLMVIQAKTSAAKTRAFQRYLAANGGVL